MNRKAVAFIHFSFCHSSLISFSLRDCCCLSLCLSFFFSSSCFTEESDAADGRKGREQILPMISCAYCHQSLFSFPFLSFSLCVVCVVVLMRRKRQTRLMAGRTRSKFAAIHIRFLPSIAPFLFFSLSLFFSSFSSPFSVSLSFTFVSLVCGRKRRKERRLLAGKEGKQSCFVLMEGLLPSVAFLPSSLSLSSFVFPFFLSHCVCLCVSLRKKKRKEERAADGRKEVSENCAIRVCCCIPAIRCLFFVFCFLSLFLLSSLSFSFFLSFAFLFCFSFHLSLCAFVSVWKKRVRERQKERESGKEWCSLVNTSAIRRCFSLILFSSFPSRSLLPLFSRSSSLSVRVLKKKWEREESGWQEGRKQSCAFWHLATSLSRSLPLLLTSTSFFLFPSCHVLPLSVCFRVWKKKKKKESGWWQEERGAKLLLLLLLLFCHPSLLSRSLSLISSLFSSFFSFLFPSFPLSVSVCVWKKREREKETAADGRKEAKRCCSPSRTILLSLPSSLSLSFLSSLFLWGRKSEIAADGRKDDERSCGWESWMLLLPFSLVSLLSFPLSCCSLLSL